MNIFQAISELVNFAFNNPLNLLKSIDIEIVDAFLAERIKEISGLETENFLISLDNYAVLHIFNKHSLKNEKNKQQIGIEINDFTQLLNVILEADKIEYHSKSWRTGKNLLFFSKQIENIYEVVLEVRAVHKKGKKSRLAITTFYIKQKKEIN